MTRDGIGRYRDEIKGVAILLVALSHADFGWTGWLLRFQQQTNIGVDMFLFLSGYGLYHSLNRSPELGGYVRRRLWRLLPAYWPLCVAWLCLMMPPLGLSTVQMLRTVTGNLLMIGFLTNVPHVISWYVTALLVSLTLAPVLYGCLKDAKRPRAVWAALLALSLAAGACFVTDNRMIAVARLPVFVIGMGFANRPPQKGGLLAGRVACLLSFAAGCVLKWLCMTRYTALLQDFGMFWYPYALMAPPLCLGCCRCLERLKRTRAVLIPLRCLGKASFEIFLFNVWFEFYCKSFLRLASPAGYLWWALGSIAAGCVYHAAVTACVARFRGAGAGRPPRGKIAAARD